METIRNPLPSVSLAPNPDELQVHRCILDGAIFVAQGHSLRCPTCNRIAPRNPLTPFAYATYDNLVFNGTMAEWREFQANLLLCDYCYQRPYVNPYSEACEECLPTYRFRAWLTTTARARHWFQPYALRIPRFCHSTVGPVGKPGAWVRNFDRLVLMIAFKVRELRLINPHIPIVPLPRFIPSPDDHSILYFHPRYPQYFADWWSLEPNSLALYRWVNYSLLLPSDWRLCLDPVVGIEGTAFRRREDPWIGQWSNPRRKSWWDEEESGGQKS